MPHPPDKWMTISQAVAETGKSERTIRRWIATHRLPTQRKAGRLLVNLADIGPDIEQATPATPDTSGALSDCQAKVAQLEAVLAEVISERDYLRQAHMMALASNQKLIEAPARRAWRWPWQAKED
jgi:hypothetical protein